VARLVGVPGDFPRGLEWCGVVYWIFALSSFCNCLELLICVALVSLVSRSPDRGAHCLPSVRVWSDEIDLRVLKASMHLPKRTVGSHEQRSRNV
jgi:hypothetical protein